VTAAPHWLAARLVEPSRAAVWFAENDAERGLTQAESSGVSVFRAKLPEPLTKESLLDAVAGVLAFPDYFGRNWDALDECLRDLTWLEASGIVLVLEGSRTAWQATPEPLGRLISCWLLAAEAWSEEGRPLHLVFCR